VVKHIGAGKVQCCRARLRAGWLGVRVPAVAGNFSLHRVQTIAGAHSAFYPRGTRCSFSGVKRPGREDNHSPPRSAEVKNAWSSISTPNTPSRHGVQFKKAQKQLYFYLCLAAVLVSSPPRPDLNFKQILEIHSLIWPPPLKFSSDVPVRAFENFLRLSKARGLAEASDPSKYYDTERNVNFLRMVQNGRPLKTPSVHTFISRGAWFWFLFKFSSMF